MKTNYRKLKIFYKRLTFKEKISILLFLLFFIIIFVKAVHDARTTKIHKKKIGFKFKKIAIIYNKIYRYSDIVSINCDEVVPIVYTKVISLKNLPIPERKKKFIDIMLPSILIANFEIKQKRKFVLYLLNKIKIGKEILPQEEKELNKLLTEYRVEDINELLTKLNTNPVSIVLAQAAIESGWGTSRFFVEANNVFGVWTFNKKEASKIKAKKANVYLKAYKSILDSVKDYYKSINLSWAYAKFRKVRLTTDDPLLLSNHLEKYSTLRRVYVERLKIIIKSNNLTKYDSCRLSPYYIQ